MGWELASPTSCRDSRGASISSQVELAEHFGSPRFCWRGRAKPSFGELRAPRRVYLSDLNRMALQVDPELVVFDGRLRAASTRVVDSDIGSARQIRDRCRQSNNSVIVHFSLYLGQMNEDILADLKQFVAATVSQQTAELTSHIESIENRIGGIERRIDGIENRLDTIEEKIDDLQSSVSEAITASNDAVHGQLQDHERRLTTLEQSAA